MWILKNARELQTHQRIHQFTHRPVRQRVLHLILNDSDSMRLPKAMRVDPVFVGATELDIDKLLRRVPALNLTLPGKRDAEEMQAVLRGCLETKPL